MKTKICCYPYLNQGFLCSVSVGKWSSDPPPPEKILVKRSPPEPEKIVRYLVLSTQKRQEIGGQKNLPPKNPFSGRFTRGVRKNFFEPKIFGKIDFIAFLGHFFRKFAKIF